MWPVLPKEHDANGLGSIERLMIDDPDAEFLFIGKLNRRRATVDDDTGDTTPTARVLRIEPLTGEWKDQAQQMLDAATLKRTSAGTLFEGDATGLASVPFSGSPDGE
jgi:hypothetical protein